MAADDRLSFFGASRIGGIHAVDPPCIFPRFPATVSPVWDLFKNAGPVHAARNSSLTHLPSLPAIQASVLPA